MCNLRQEKTADKAMIIRQMKNNIYQTRNITVEKQKKKKEETDV
jgi:hypothetical protein